MIDKKLSFDLPTPWKDKRFETQQIGVINFLVGPNGSGKSRFAEALAGQLQNARLLGTDRLSGMEQVNALRSVFGDHLAHGLAKNHFGHFKDALSMRVGAKRLTSIWKQAYFVYDLDSLFRGNLRACVKGDGSVQSFLMTAGVGNNFPRYRGEECLTL